MILTVLCLPSLSVFFQCLALCLAWNRSTLMRKNLMEEGSEGLNGWTICPGLLFVSFSMFSTPPMFPALSRSSVLIVTHPFAILTSSRKPFMIYHTLIPSPLRSHCLILMLLHLSFPMFLFIISPSNPFRAGIVFNFLKNGFLFVCFSWIFSTFSLRA